MTSMAAKQTVPDQQARTASVRVRDQLLRDLLAGVFAPGEKLGIEALAARYQTSTTPIRAALQELQGQGLVSMQPHHGARVREVDEEYVRNIYELRHAVLGVLLPHAVRHVSHADVDRFEQAQAEYEEQVEEGTALGILESNRRFHHLIYALARNPEALEVMNRTGLLTDALRLKFGYGRGRLSSVVVQHRKLLGSLRDRDAQGALAIARAANDSGLADLLALMQHDTGDRVVGTGAMSRIVQGARARSG
jgi:DNA-binding GntR family transcriptional regulator